MDIFKRFWWFLVPFLLSVFGVLGCTMTFDSGRMHQAAESIPTGIAHYDGELPGSKVAFSVDPWLAIEKAVEGISAVIDSVIPGLSAAPEDPGERLVQETARYEPEKPPEG